MSAPVGGLAPIGSPAEDQPVCDWKRITIFVVGFLAVMSGMLHLAGVGVFSQMGSTTAALLTAGGYVILFCGCFVYKGCYDVKPKDEEDEESESSSGRSSRSPSVDGPPEEKKGASGKTATPSSGSKSEESESEEGSTSDSLRGPSSDDTASEAEADPVQPEERKDAGGEGGPSRRIDTLGPYDQFAAFRQMEGFDRFKEIETRRRKGVQPNAEAEAYATEFLKRAKAAVGADPSIGMPSQQQAASPQGVQAGGASREVEVVDPLTQGLCDNTQFWSLTKEQLDRIKIEHRFAGELDLLYLRARSVPCALAVEQTLGYYVGLTAEEIATLIESRQFPSCVFLCFDSSKLAELLLEPAVRDALFAFKSVVAAIDRDVREFTNAPRWIEEINGLEQMRVFKEAAREMQPKLQPLAETTLADKAITEALIRKLGLPLGFTIVKPLHADPARPPFSVSAVTNLFLIDEFWTLSLPFLRNIKIEPAFVTALELLYHRSRREAFKGIQEEVEEGHLGHLMVLSVKQISLQVTQGQFPICAFLCFSSEELKELMKNRVIFKAVMQMRKTLEAFPLLFGLDTWIKDLKAMPRVSIASQQSPQGSDERKIK